MERPKNDISAIQELYKEEEVESKDYVLLNKCSNIDSAPQSLACVKTDVSLSMETLELNLGPCVEKGSDNSNYNETKPEISKTLSSFVSTSNDHSEPFAVGRSSFHKGTDAFDIFNQSIVLKQESTKSKKQPKKKVVSGYFCGYCNAKFTKVTSLSNHMLSHKNQNTKPEVIINDTFNLISKDNLENPSDCKTLNLQFSLRTQELEKIQLATDPVHKDEQRLHSTDSSDSSSFHGPLQTDVCTDTVYEHEQRSCFTDIKGPSDSSPFLGPLQRSICIDTVCEDEQRLFSTNSIDPSDSSPFNGPVQNYSPTDTVPEDEQRLHSTDSIHPSDSSLFYGPLTSDVCTASEEPSIKSENQGYSEMLDEISGSPDNGLVKRPNYFSDIFDRKRRKLTSNESTQEQRRSLRLNTNKITSSQLPDNESSSETSCSSGKEWVPNVVLSGSSDGSCSKDDFSSMADSASAKPTKTSTHNTSKANNKKSSFLDQNKILKCQSAHVVPKRSKLCLKQDDRKHQKVGKGRKIKKNLAKGLLALKTVNDATELASKKKEDRTVSSNEKEVIPSNEEERDIILKKTDWTCSSCGTSFDREVCLKSHNLANHKGKKENSSFRCDCCRVCTSNLGNLQRHWRLAHGLEFWCRLCGILFLSNDDQKLHVCSSFSIHQVKTSDHHPAEDRHRYHPCFCKGCNSIHLTTEHSTANSILSSIDKTYKMYGGFSGSSFSSKKSPPPSSERNIGLSGSHAIAADHKKQHPSTSYGCEMCKKTLSRRSYLHVHWRIVHGLKFWCNCCGVLFQSKADMAKHTCDNTTEQATRKNKSEEEQEQEGRKYHPCFCKVCKNMHVTWEHSKQRGTLVTASTKNSCGPIEQQGAKTDPKGEKVAVSSDCIDSVSSTSDPQTATHPLGILPSTAASCTVDLETSLSPKQSLLLPNIGNNSDNLAKFYNCNECDASFSQEVCHRNHVYVCQKQYPERRRYHYVSYDSNDQILTNTHRLDASLTDKRNIGMICGICKISFEHKVCLRNHAVAAHGKKQHHSTNYACGSCNQTFSWKHGLQRHWRSVHGWKFWCKHCGLLFQSERDMDKHKRNNKTNGQTAGKCNLEQDQEQKHGKYHPCFCKICKNMHVIAECPKQHSTSVIASTETSNKLTDRRGKGTCEGNPVTVPSNCIGPSTTNRLTATEPSGILLSSEASCTGHQEISPSAELHNCNKCGASFTHEVCHRNHVFVCQRQYAERGHCVSCDACGQIFQDVESLQAHWRNYHLLQLWCICCGVLFFNHLYYRQHKCKMLNEQQGESLNLSYVSINKATEVHPCFCKDCNKIHIVAKNPTDAAVFGEKILEGKTAVIQEGKDLLLETKFKCSMCSMEFLNQGSLKNHIENAHKHKCIYCSKVFGSKYKMRGHVLLHFNENFRILQRESKTNVHVIWKCNKCESKSQGEQLFRKHVMKHFAVDQGIHKCHVCNKVFAQNNRLQHHLLCHRETHPLKCSICGKGYISEDAYRNHMEEHDEGAQRVCDQCGKEFRSRIKLYHHVHNHHKTADWPCKVCGKIFRTSASLNQHMLAHKLKLSGKKHMCETCGKKFLRKHHLRQHMVQHLSRQAREFECHHCGYRFGWKHHLHAHIKRKHEDTQ